MVTMGLHNYNYLYRCPSEKDMLLCVHACGKVNDCAEKRLLELASPSRREEAV